MPIYEFECLKCGYEFEKLQRVSDPPPSKCPECGSKRVSQLLSAPAIQFKGTGWYVTDYARKSSTEASAGTKSSGKDGGNASKPADAGSGDSTETKATTEKEKTKTP